MVGGPLKRNELRLWFNDMSKHVPISRKSFTRNFSSELLLVNSDNLEVNSYGRGSLYNDFVQIDVEHAALLRAALFHEMGEFGGKI